MQAISNTIENLDDLDTLAPRLQKLGARHTTYGVTEEHYEPVGAALLWTLDKGLGEAFTPETKEAWTAAYGLIAATMIGGSATFRDLMSS